MESESGTSARLSPVVCTLGESCSEELAFIDSFCNRPPWSARLFSTEFSNPCARVYGARLHGRLAGFLLRHLVIDEAHIVSLGVHPDLRRCGAAGAMLTRCLSDTVDEGGRTVTLEVRRSNQPAISLYAGFGFIEAGVRQGYYSDNREDALLLRLDLREYLASRRK